MGECCPWLHSEALASEGHGEAVKKPVSAENHRRPMMWPRLHQAEDARPDPMLGCCARALVERSGER